MTAPKAETTSSHFVRGLTKPTSLSVSVMALTVLFLAAVALLGLPDIMASRSAILLAAYPTDHDLFATAKLLRLNAVEDQRPILAIVGGSETLAAFGRTKDVHEAVLRATGTDYDVVNLSANRQSFLDHLRFIDRLPENRETIIVMGVGPVRFTRTKAHYQESIDDARFGFPSKAFDEEATRLGLKQKPETGFLVYDYPGFYLPRFRSFPYVIGRMILGARISQDEMEYVGFKKPPKEFDTHSREVMSRFENNSRDGTQPLAERLLIDIVARTRRNPRQRLVLIEQAINPAFVQKYMGQARYAEHLRYMQDFARKHQVTYWNLARDTHLGPDSYFDWAHINSAEAQHKIQRALAARVAEMKR